MFWFILAMLLGLLALGVVGILDSATMGGEFVQFLMICTLVALGIHRARRYRAD